MLGGGDFNVRGDTSHISPFDFSMFFSFSPKASDFEKNQSGLKKSIEN